MSNEITKINEQSTDSWSDEASSQRIVQGKLLTFADWRWLVGKKTENQTLPDGTRFVAADMARAWVFWQGGKPAETITVMAGRRPPDRDELSHREPDDAWEEDPRGDQRDPWQFTRYVYLVDPETAEMYTFTTSTFGGAQCVGDLARSITMMRAAHPHATPVVELRSRPMQTKHGQKSAPVLKVVGWQGTDVKAPSAPAPARIAAPYSDDGSRGSPERTARMTRDDLNDSIPFDLGMTA